MTSQHRSRTAQGNKFRDSVKQLLQLIPGCTNIRAECLVGTQAVDLYYEEPTSFRTMRVACECKDYGRPLTRELIASHIYPRYAPLLQNGHVDAVRIIAPLPLQAIADAYVEECGFTFNTLDQLESRVMDFRQYLTGLISGFTEDGLDQYYVPPLLEDGQDLESWITAWIEGNSSQPVAILAGYGMGKTCFARRLACLLAERALRDFQSRVPVLIPLSEISGEQTLEGLLGKLLAAQHRIPGYHFSPFSELNRRGRFVVILDGFDEMKHTMSWAEFAHNFSQLNRLNGTRSRVILLGRPSALLSGDEEMYVLRGKRRTGSQELTVPGAPEYTQLRLAQFSAERALSFIATYAKYRAPLYAATRGSEAVTAETLDLHIEDIRKDPEMLHLAARPVQAKMLADLAIDRDVTWRSFSRYELYQVFIQRITEREASKPARVAFHPEQRLRFIRRVAWWVWSRSKTTAFTARELHPTLFESITGPGAADPESHKRDLLAGSLLEKKIGEHYHFPHRSFAEFLVAQHLGFEGEAELDGISAALTPEIVDFLKESEHVERVARWGAYINSEDTRVSAELLQLIAWCINRFPNAHSLPPSEEFTPRNVMLGFYRLMDRQVPLETVVQYLREVSIDTDSLQVVLTSLRAMFVLENHARGGRKEVIQKQVVALLLGHCLDELKYFGEASDPSAVRRVSPLCAVLFDTCDSYALSGVISARPGQLYQRVVNLIDVPWQGSWASSLVPQEAVPIAFAELGTLDETFAQDDAAVIVRTFFQRFPSPSKLNVTRARKPRLGKRPA